MLFAPNNISDTKKGIKAVINGLLQLDIWLQNDKFCGISII